MTVKVYRHRPADSTNRKFPFRQLSGASLLFQIISTGYFPLSRSFGNCRLPETAGCASRPGPAAPGAARASAGPAFPDTGPDAALHIRSAVRPRPFPEKDEAPQSAVRPSPAGRRFCSIFRLPHRAAFLDAEGRLPPARCPCLFAGTAVSRSRRRRLLHKKSLSSGTENVSKERRFSSMQRRAPMRRYISMPIQVLAAQPMKKEMAATPKLMESISTNCGRKGSRRTTATKKVNRQMMQAALNRQQASAA